MTFPDLPTLAACSPAILPVVIGLTKFGIAMLNSCDTVTARAPKLPAGAYRGKVVWITGASSGLGREMARQLGKLGAVLILSARSIEGLEETKGEVLAAGARPEDVKVLTLDMEKLSEIPDAAARALEYYGGVDVLVNNAGFSQRELGVHTAFEVDVHMTNVNYLACVCLAKQLLPSMSGRGGGRLINISSVAGKVGIPLRTAYCGSKHALLGFFDALRAEEHARGSGVRVTNVCPGSVRTNVARNAVLATVGTKRGQSDTNIDNGLDPAWVVERILAGAHSGIDECWIARGRELLATYLAQYLPDAFKQQARKQAVAYMATTLKPVEK